MSKKYAITSIFSNITYNIDTVRGMEVYYLTKALREQGISIDIIGRKNSRNSDATGFIDLGSVQLEKYDGVFIQLTPANFFGGQISDDTITLIKMFREFKGEIMFLINDPRIRTMNPVKYVQKRFPEIYGDSMKLDRDLWDNREKNGTYLYGGKDLEKFCGVNSESFVFFDLFTLIFKENHKRRVKSQESFDGLVEIEKNYDICYRGAKRAGYREKKLKRFMNKGGNNLLIGYKSDKIQATQIKKIKNQDLLTKISECRASLIIGDKEHEDNIMTFRLYESLMSGAIAFIDIDYDPNKEYIQNETLRDLIYVTDGIDIISKLDYIDEKDMYNEIKELQYKEFERIVMDSEIDLSYFK